MIITYPISNQTNVITSGFTITGTFTNATLDAKLLVAKMLDANNNVIGSLFQFVGGSTSGSLDPAYMT
jgi:hypothetical protein